MCHKSIIKPQACYMDNLRASAIFERGFSTKFCETNDEKNHVVINNFFCILGWKSLSLNITGVVSIKFYISFTDRGSGPWSITIRTKRIQTFAGLVIGGFLFRKRKYNEYFTARPWRSIEPQAVSAC